MAKNDLLSQVEKQTLTIELPKLVRVDDYHDFDTIVPHILKNLGIKAKVQEVGSSEGMYIGIIYQKMTPKLKATIKKIQAQYEEDHY